MPREFRQNLDDIIESISLIKDYTSGISFEDFSANRKTQDAVIRNLEIIGEAAKALPDDIKQKAHSTDWRKIIALRNILIHEYFGVNLKLIWDVIQNKLEELQQDCRYLL